MKLKQTLVSLAVAAMLVLPGAAFAQNRIASDNNQNSKALSPKQILPANGGADLTYIAQSAPGATMNTQAGAGNFSSFGMSALSNNFTINGMPENDPFLGLNKTGATNLMLGQNDISAATVVSNGSATTWGPVRPSREPRK